MIRFINTLKGRERIKSSQLIKMIDGYTDDAVCKAFEKCENFETLPYEDLRTIAYRVVLGIKRQYKNNPHKTFEVELDFNPDYINFIRNVGGVSIVFNNLLEEFIDEYDLHFIDTTRTYTYRDLTKEGYPLCLNVGIMETDDWVYNEETKTMKCIWGECVVTNVEDEEDAEKAFKILHKLYTKHNTPVEGEYTYADVKNIAMNCWPKRILSAINAGLF